MDIATFRILVDETKGIADGWPTDLVEKYKFLHLPQTGAYATRTICEELYNCIRSAFVTGSINISEQCRNLISELIYDQILENLPLEPYSEILAHIKDATQFQKISGIGTYEEWRQAVEFAHLSSLETSLGSAVGLPRLYPENYAVGLAVANLRRIGYAIDRAGSKITLSDNEETRLVTKIERLISEVGGLRVARKIFDRIRPVYDQRQERYHLVANVGHDKIAQPLMPWGYLLQLAVKHCDFGKPLGISDDNKVTQIGSMIRDYATVLEVQDYSHFPHFPFVPMKMIEALQKKALADFIYKFSQVRGSDVSEILLGLIDSTLLDEPFEKGWTIRQAIVVIDAIMNQIAGPGLSRIRARDVRKLCSSIDANLVDVILTDVLSHPVGGSNQKFSKPTDAPNISPNHSRDDGVDFAQMPLLRYTDQSFILIDRSVCAGACIESIFAQMRKKVENFDRDLGEPIERCARSMLEKHNIETHTGKYMVERKKGLIGKHEGQCDILIETNEIIILIEVKKKPLTRRARAGSDISLMLDLTQSLLEAQVQAGNHEVRLFQDGYLELNYNDEIHRVELDGRKVERIALSFTDFGSFHDRMFLEKFLNAIIRLKFNAHDPSYAKKFDDINRLIADLQEQSRFLYPDDGQHRRPYFNCWFFSLPQLLIMLDGVDGAEAFRNALWATRGLGNVNGDLCYDISHAERMKAANPLWYETMYKMGGSGKTFMTG